MSAESIRRLKLAMAQFERPSVLVVEDDADDIELTRRALLSADIDVVFAISAAGAIIEASHRPFHLILLDLKLSDCANPVWLIQVLKGIQPTCAVAILTGSIADGMEEIFAKWAIAVLIKPLSVGQVKDAFQTIAK